MGIFRFKQFSVDDTNCAMKTGTDGVLLGAWANPPQNGNILDIGTGSGLIALMLAQRSEASITAIEIDEDAAQQAHENFESSPWKNQLTSINNDIISWTDSQVKEQFDLIVSNPPFFQHSLHNPDEQRTLARHTSSLSYQDLCRAASLLLKNGGNFCLILPFDSSVEFIEIAEEHSLFSHRVTKILDKKGKPAKRILIELSKTKEAEVIRETMILKNDDNSRHSDQVAITKDYYL